MRTSVVVTNAKALDRPQWLGFDNEIVLSETMEQRQIMKKGQIYSNTV
jgi:hypothetical protein